MKHGSKKRPTVYFASMDIKTTFDVAQMSMDRSERPYFETFPSTRCIRQGRVEAPPALDENGHEILESLEPEWVKKKWA